MTSFVRTIFLSTILLIIAFCFSNCRGSFTYDKYVKELDSLKVVLEQSVDQFKSIDSAVCFKAYSKQYTYSVYVNTHLKDTVSKTVAENLQKMHSVEKGLRDYLLYRSYWINDANISINQLLNLSNDIKHETLEEDEALEFISQEKKHAEQMIDELKGNTENLRNHLEVFNQSVPVCEAFLKTLNGGVLPELIVPEIK